MEHTSKGSPKILKQCTLPLTGTKCVNRIITEMGVFDVVPGKGLVLIEQSSEYSIQQIRDATEAPFEVSPNLKINE